MKILITGGSGLVGSAIKKISKNYKQHTFIFVNSKEYDLTQFSQTRLMLIRIEPDCVIHLAANGGVHSENGMEASWEEILESNIIGTYNVFQASIKNGVKRIIFASSGSTIMGYEDQSPYSEIINGKIPNESIPLITKKSEPNPKSFYSVSKLFGDDLAIIYSSLFNISIICIRIGGCS